VVPKRKSKAPLVIAVLLLAVGAAVAVYFLVLAPPPEVASNTGTATGVKPKVETSPTGKETSETTSTAPVSQDNELFVEKADLWKQETDALRKRIADIPSNPADYGQILSDITTLIVSKAGGERAKLDEAAELQKEADAVFGRESEKGADAAIEKSREHMSAGRFSEAVAALDGADSPYSKFLVWKNRVRDQLELASNADLQAKEYLRMRGEYGGKLAPIESATLERWKATLSGFSAIPAETELGGEIARRISEINSELEARRAREEAKEREFAAAMEKADSLLAAKKGAEAVRMLNEYSRKNPGTRYASDADAKAQSIKDEMERMALAEFFNKRDLSGWFGDKAAWRAQGATLIGQASSDRSVIYKGEESWSSYTLKFKMRITKGDFAVSFASTLTPTPKTGYEFMIPSEICDPNTFYAFTFEVADGKITAKSDLSQIPTVITLENTRGPIGFLLRRGGSVYLQDVEFNLNEGK
jgi:hypothetical protein